MLLPESPSSSNENCGGEATENTINAYPTNNILVDEFTEEEAIGIELKKRQKMIGNHSSTTSLLSENYEPREELDERQEPTEMEIVIPQESKITIGSRMDLVLQLQKTCQITKESHELLDRAVEYMQLYLSRYMNGHFNTDWVRRMFFYARIHGAPVSKLHFPNDSFVRFSSIASYFLASAWTKEINLEKFFSSMDHLESKYGERLWEVYFIYGNDFFDARNQKGTNFFRWQIISTIRLLHKEIMRKKWAEVTQYISDIGLTISDQFNSNSYFSFLRNNLAPYLPGIYFGIVQCLLESKHSIEEMSTHFKNIFAAFKKLAIARHFQLMDNNMLFFSHFLTFHLVNLHIQRRNEKDVNLLSNATNDFRLHVNAERRRVILLLEYCLEIEKYILSEQQNEQSQYKKQSSDRSPANYFLSFLDNLFSDPRSSVGLLPLAVWGSIQFNFEEELLDHLLNACTENSYLLIHFHNVLVRFQLDHFAGRLFEKFFDLSVDLLATSPVLLDILEQRSLNPTTFGAFDSVISQNLRSLFMFLDLGRHRTDFRAWALFHSNLSYLCDNGEMMRLLLKPMWTTRNDWWPRFHSMPLSSTNAERMREESFAILRKL